MSFSQPTTFSSYNTTNVASSAFRIGQIVHVAGKRLDGRIAYIGSTSFAPGKWIGIVLNEERGKNNGQVGGITYFKCASNYGLFVRPTQLIVKKLVNVSEEASIMDSRSSSASSAAAATRTTTPKKEAAQRHHNTLTKAAAAADGSRTKSVLQVKPIPKLPSSNSLLKTTKINQPKEVTPVHGSPSQVSLHNMTTVAAVIPSTSRGIRPMPPPLLAPKRSKTSMSPSESFCCGKRASFVETGFLEILRPQFTPGQPLRSPTFSSMMLNSTSNHNLQDVKQQNKHLESKVSELCKEIDELKAQKTEDKRKLQEMERLRLQNEQLLEFKLRIMEQQTSLQRELQRLRQELREFNEAKTKYQRDLDEAAENIELLTLDKEMAEEKAETIQLEMELLQEQNEELGLDVEILKAENERLLSGMQIDDNITASERKEDNASLLSMGEIKKLEQYNQRLRETVIKLRDVLTVEKQQCLKCVKELETRTSEILELKKTKEMLTKRCDVMESHIIDLREQVDAALGAETMVATLADAKLELEERVRLLEDEVNELEALEEIHEQLIESNQELERDLRDEIDALNTQVRTLQQEKDNALETVYERDCTIMKFRALVKTLNEREQIREQITNTGISTTATTASTSEELNSIASSNQEFIPGVDFQQVFASTKAYGRALELQLANIELKMLSLQIEYLKAFLPEDLLLRGCSYDVILILIVLQRSMEKVDIICSGIHEKFPASCEFGRDAIFEGYSVHRFAFRTKCLYLLKSLKMTLQQLEFALNHCDYEVATHAAIYRGEMELQEKYLDDLLSMLKKGLLDENTPVEVLERSSHFFNTLLSNLFVSHNLAELLDEQKLYANLMEVYDNALDCVNTHAGLLYTIIQLGDEHTDSFCSMQFLMEHARSFKMQLKTLQRKLPTNTITFSTLQWPQLQRLHERNDHLGRLISLLSSTAKEATKDIANSSSKTNTDYASEIAIDHERLWRIVTLQCQRVAPDGYQHNAVEFFQNSATLLQEQLDEFQLFIKEKESTFSANPNTVYVRANDITILQQAKEVKKHYDEVKLLHIQLSERDKEIKALKQLNKNKQNDFSELQIRKDMAEKQLQRLQHDQEQIMQEMSFKLERILEEMQHKHGKLLNSVEQSQEKLLYLERSHEKLKTSLTDNTKSINICSQEAYQEITRLYQIIKQQRLENISIKSIHLKDQMAKMEPLYIPKQQQQSAANLLKQEDLQFICKELTQLKKSWILGYLALPDSAERNRIHKDSLEVSQHILDIYCKTHPHRTIPTEFAQYATKEAKQIFQ